SSHRKRKFSDAF
nr:Chain B, B6NLS [synthetic construct]3ZIQ_C Chain C, B6NLS [synthetic construct]